MSSQTPLQAETDTAPRFITWLTARLGQEMPPQSARGRLAPALSYGRHFGPPAFDARPAAVVILLDRVGDDWQVPLTVRPETMLAHAGQISLPGGMVEPGETNREAGLRELEEELGVSAADVSVVGSLSPLYVFVSNFIVTPWVAVATRPISLRPNPSEVAAVLEVPLAHLSSADNHGTHQYRRGELEFSAPHIGFGEHRIWGATGIILAEFLAILAECPMKLN